VMPVTHTIILPREGLYLLRETTAIIHRPRFAGAK